MRKVACLMIVVIIIAEIFLISLPNTSENVEGIGLADSPWPCFQGNVRHTGQSSYDTSHLDGTLKWSIRLGFVDCARPVIDAQGRIIFSSDGSVNALTRDGKFIWNYSINSFGVSCPSIDNSGNIYVCAGDGNLYALNQNGSLRWSCMTSKFTYSSPTIGTDGTIYVGSSDSKLYAFNPDGSINWNFTANGSVTSPALRPDGAIIFGSGNNVYAMYPNGTLIWNYTTCGTNLSPSIDANGIIYIGSADNNTYALNPDGSLKWIFKTGGYITSSPAIGHDGSLYFGSRDEHFYAINLDGTLKWSYFNDESFGWSSPAIGHDGTIYVGSSDHKLYAFTPNGDVKWTCMTGGMVDGSPSIDYDGTLYFGAMDGHIYALGNNGHFLPGKPRNLSVQIVDNQTILNWQTPDSNGGTQIIGYGIYRSVHSITADGATYSIVSHLATVGNVLTYTDSSAKNEENYSYYVTAINSVGEGHAATEGADEISKNSSSLIIPLSIACIAIIACAAVYVVYRRKSQ